MALIDYIDGVNRRVYLSEDTVNASIHPVDIYKEMRTLRATNEELRKFDLFMKAEGNIYKGNNKYTERYVILLQGTKIVPYNSSHILTITGTILTDDGVEGVGCFDRSLIDDTSIVDINYAPPQVEVIVVPINSNGGLTQEEHDKLMGVPSADDNAQAVWNVQL